MTLLALLPAGAAGLFRSCVDNGPLEQIQKPPGAIARLSDQAWRRFARKLTTEATERFGSVRVCLAEENRKLAKPVEIPDADEGQFRIENTYGQLPEIYVDEAPQAAFPVPLNRPNRFSWFQAARDAGDTLGEIRRLEGLVASWSALPAEKRAERFDDIEELLRETGADLTRISHQVRYLDTWIPLLDRQWLASLNEKKTAPPYQIIGAILRRDFNLLASLREHLKPHRKHDRSYLPKSLKDAPAGIVRFPITTDIRDRKFLAEVEGALITHWNQTDWARKNKISFHIQWDFVAKNSLFAQERSTLSDHLNRFPKNEAIMTTGGMTTHVRKHALVFGPGRITPRTIAHEMGHLMGFEDCYLRTITAQGAFGLGVLEWENPIYPDDIMCENNVGVPRAEVW